MEYGRITTPEFVVFVIIEDDIVVDGGKILEKLIGITKEELLEECNIMGWTYDRL